ncbi:hypothetical protein [Catenuloplanes indicus]|uniref:Uncharacterized protein n=1 Tax=Catenuloplanes indicus TaxID=137267 RepID=A0AAE3W886_9ACTN|nr:hypothetical protein [Catenuloplanes indicus]MDQ0363356.1 hypothetical protein [Catenuloplanes indicus]MDQ0371678.1 hypothetical protein [Catenuloplanes indicus]
MRQDTTCNHQPCHSYCPRIGRLAADEGRPPVQRTGVGALASTDTVTTSNSTKAA